MIYDLLSCDISIYKVSLNPLLEYVIALNSFTLALRTSF